MKKKNMLKSMLALATAFTMGLSLGAPAFAADPSVTGGTANADGTVGATLEFDGTLATPEIKIEMPDPSGGLFINPYNLSVNIGHDGSAAISSDGGVVSPIYGITSQSNADLAIGVIGTVKPSEGSAVVINADGAIELLEEATGEKEVYVYIEFANDGKEVDVKGDGSVIKYDGTFYTGYAKQPNQYLLPQEQEDGALATVIGVLPQYSDEDDSGDFGSGDVEGVAAFIFGGEAQMQSAVAWKNTDTIDVSVIFSFNPLGQTLIVRDGATDEGALYTVAVAGIDTTAGTIAVTFPAAADSVEGDTAAIPVKLNNATLLDKDGNTVTYLNFTCVNKGTEEAPDLKWFLDDELQGTLTLVKHLEANAKCTITVTPAADTTP